MTDRSSIVLDESGTNDQSVADTNSPNSSDQALIPAHTQPTNNAYDIYSMPQELQDEIWGHAASLDSVEASALLCRPRALHDLFVEYLVDRRFHLGMQKAFFRTNTLDAYAVLDAVTASGRHRRRVEVGPNVVKYGSHMRSDYKVQRQFYAALPPPNVRARVEIIQLYLVPPGGDEPLLRPHLTWRDCTYHRSNSSWLWLAEQLQSLGFTSLRELHIEIFVHMHEEADGTFSDRGLMEFIKGWQKTLGRKACISFRKEFAEARHVIRDLLQDD